MSTPTNCPMCGHPWEAHPFDGDGRRFCRVAMNELPSCVVCAAPMRALEKRHLASPPVSVLGADTPRDTK